jgi:hypothetical protein
MVMLEKHVDAANELLGGEAEQSESAKRSVKFW